MQEIIQDTIKREGGFSNYRSDRGGATYQGVTQRTYDSWRLSRKLPTAPVATASGNEINSVYNDLYAKPFAFIYPVDHALFKLLFNAAVQHGSDTAGKFFQTALNDVYQGNTRLLVVDGVVGMVTRARYEALPLDFRKALLPIIVAARARLYASLLTSTTQRVFASGWFNRLADDLS
jgi:lysozyme family protein